MRNLSAIVSLGNYVRCSNWIELWWFNQRYNCFEILPYLSLDLSASPTFFIRDINTPVPVRSIQIFSTEYYAFMHPWDTRIRIFKSCTHKTTMGGKITKPKNESDGIFQPGVDKTRDFKWFSRQLHILKPHIRYSFSHDDRRYSNSSHPNVTAVVIVNTMDARSLLLLIKSLICAVLSVAVLFISSPKHTEC